MTGLVGGLCWWEAWGPLAGPPLNPALLILIAQQHYPTKNCAVSIIYHVFYAPASLGGGIRG